MQSSITPLVKTEAEMDHQHKDKKDVTPVC